MKTISWQDFWITVVVIFVLAPWALLLVEGVSLFLTGVVLTSIPWNAARVMIALMWPVLWGFIAAGISG